ncbi:hypothetical protein KI387_015569, partial [Taxus chinensis]
MESNSNYSYCPPLLHFNGFSNVQCNEASNMGGNVFASSPFLDRRDGRQEYVESFPLLDGAESWPESRFMAALDSCPDNEFARFSRSKGSSDLMHKTHFTPHLQIEAINQALEKGEAFRAVFRVNMHNRLEGYCTLDGSRLTFLFSGPGEQNRVVEGDVVSIIMDPVSSWPKLKGARSKQQIRISDTNGNTITAESEDLSKAHYR